jgi:hypothetical protein
VRKKRILILDTPEHVDSENIKLKIGPWTFLYQLFSKRDFLMHKIGRNRPKIKFLQLESYEAKIDRFSLPSCCHGHQVYLFIHNETLTLQLLVPWALESLGITLSLILAGQTKKPRN